MQLQLVTPLNGADVGRPHRRHRAGSTTARTAASARRRLHLLVQPSAFLLRDAHAANRLLAALRKCMRAALLVVKGGLGTRYLRDEHRFRGGLHPNRLLQLGALTLRGHERRVLLAQRRPHELALLVHVQ